MSRDPDLDLTNSLGLVYQVQGRGRGRELRHKSISYTAAILVALATLFSSATVAQQVIHRGASAIAGKPTRLGVFVALKHDCTTAPAPEVRVLTSPKHGALIIRSGKMRTNRVKRCPGLEAPVRLVEYQSRPQFQGTDQVRYEVKNVAGKVEMHSVTIMVGQKASPTLSDDQFEL